jgi:hypothetical protein
MRLKYLGLAVGILVLAVAIVLFIGCQNQPTGPEGGTLPQVSKARETTTTTSWGSTTTTSGGKTTTTPPTSTIPTTYAGGDGANRIVVRARGVAGSEHIYVAVGGNRIADFNLQTSYVNYFASTDDNTGNITVCFDNDNGVNRDVQIDYIDVNGERRQAEDQSYNTGVWQNGSCGGEYSEWLQCNGCIGFGDVSGGGATSTAATTTTTSSRWWGGGWWW